jgi:hypothetical protein
MKSIWNKNEIHVSDELIDLSSKLREEFLSHHTDFFTTFKKGTTYASQGTPAELNEEEKLVWKVEGLRYTLPDQQIEQNFFLEPKVRSIFPTATSLTEKYIVHIGCTGYSILEAGGTIKWHSDIENTSQETIRIHIPLIIPEGEVYLNVNGEKIYWSELFAFDNSVLHSAYNGSEKRRLIYIIDLTRSFLGIPTEN